MMNPIGLGLGLSIRSVNHDSVGLEYYFRLGQHGSMGLEDYGTKGEYTDVDFIGLKLLTKG